jgi:hypothetical protein
MNGGNCSDNGTSFSCSCPVGYTGQRCEGKYCFQKFTRRIFSLFNFHSRKEFCGISLSHEGVNPPFLEREKSKRCENNFSNI